VYKQGRERTLSFPKTGYKIVPPGILVSYLSHIYYQTIHFPLKKFPDLRDSEITLI